MRASVKFHSALAQLVEQMTVNHWVAGSSPAGGAKQEKGSSNGRPFFSALRAVLGLAVFSLLQKRHARRPWRQRAQLDEPGFRAALRRTEERRKSMIFGRRRQPYPAVPTNQKQKRATLGAALSKTLSNNREQLIAT